MTDQNAQIEAAISPVELAKRAYRILCTNLWKERPSDAGQALLCDLRDYIASSEGRSAEDVQNEGEQYE
jgi:hypothetical protein